MKKLVLILVLLLVVVVVGGVVTAFFFIDRAAKLAVEKGGTYAMGVETTLGSVNVGLLSGSVSLSELKVANPPGYKTDRFFGLGAGNVSVSLSSLRSPIVEVPEFKLADITVNLEKAGGKANYQAILDNIKRFESGGGPAQSKPSGDEKRFVVKSLQIKNVKVHVDLLPAGGQLTQVNIPIESIDLTDVGTAGKGVPMGELANIVIKAVLAVVAEKGPGLLPAEILGDLQGGLAQLQNLDQLGVKLSSNLGAEGQKMLDQAKEQVGKQVDKALEDAKKKAEDGLKNLIPGGKK